MNDERTTEELEAEHNRLADEMRTLQLQQMAIGEELDRRRNQATAAQVLAGIDRGMLPALVKLATIEMTAKPEGLEPEVNE